MVISSDFVQEAQLLKEHLMKGYPSIKSLITFTFIGFIVGVTGAPSFLGTRWDLFQIDFFFWWSIVSTLMSLGLVIFSVWQYWQNRSQTEKNRAQIKVWMQDANGISLALKRIVRDNLDHRYSSTNDISNAIWSIEATTFSLYQSLYEERCVSEEEYRDKQRKIAEILDKRQLRQLAEGDEPQARNIESSPAK